MRTANRSKWVAISIVVLAVAAATVGTVRAADHRAASRPKIERIVPIATPVELNPCAMGACF